MANDKFVPIELENIPRDAFGNVGTDLYVHLPTANRFICYVIKGDELSPRKLEALKAHVEPRLYVPVVEAPPPTPPAQDVREGVRIDAMKNDYVQVFRGAGISEENLKLELITKEAEAELRQVFESVLDPSAAENSLVAEKLQSMADDIVKVIAPEIEDIKGHLLRNTKYLKVMNDSSAISSLAVLFGLANGFDTQRSYKELAYATLVMDIAMTEFDETTINAYYRNPDALDAATLQKIKTHPVKSHQLATEKLKSMTEVTKQLVLTHHELRNGKGYPRGLRTDTIFPIARVLSLAVDVFENLKRDELDSSRSLTIQDILRMFIDPGIEPHLRRHDTKMVQTILRFMDPTPPEGADGAPSRA